MITELTLPDLLSILLCKNARFVEYSLAVRANFGITSCQLCLVGQAIKSNLEDIGIEFCSIFVSLTNPVVCSSDCLNLTLHTPPHCTILLVTKVQITAKII